MELEERSHRDGSQIEKLDHSKHPDKDKSLWIRFNLPLLGECRFNPLVSGISILLIWSFVAWCCIAGENVPFYAWKTFLIHKFTWFYIGCQNSWTLFAIILYFSKYSEIKMGKDDEKPEYNDATWFMMLFACGIGTGLFFFGVAEPIYHYTSSNRYYADPTIPDNTLAQIAMNVTLYHWGIHAWIVYSLVGMILGLMAYRENLPLTMKSCFYPLIGDQIFGWMGDLLDIITVITTLFGVCTSLGLGTRQIYFGISLIVSDIDLENVNNQIVIIWCVTAIATLSAVSGVGMGIRRLSESCFIVGMFLMVLTFFQGQTFYLFNLTVQSIGFYLQNIIQLGLHTDAFEMLGPSHGDKDRNRFIPSSFPAPDGPSDWMESWTMFYWGWWIAWCPFVGMFIAKISRGRTLKEFIHGTLSAPVLYTFLWMIIFGGEGLRIEREAASQGYCCSSESFFYSNNSVLVSLINSSSKVNDVISSESSNWLCSGSAGCGPCALSLLTKYESENVTYGELANMHKSLGRDFGSVSYNRDYARLSCHSTEQMWFDVLRTYGDIGYGICIISLISIILYFVTSSDSGSLVIDCLTSNGDPDPPIIQRVFWSFTEGATASALLMAGNGSNDSRLALKALQTAGLIAGLPYTFIICLLCVSIWRYVSSSVSSEKEKEEKETHHSSFANRFFSPFFTESFKSYDEEQVQKSFRLLTLWMIEIFRAPWTLGIIAAKVFKSDKVWTYQVSAYLLFGLFIFFHLLEIQIRGSWAIAWWFYLCYISYFTIVRHSTRSLYKIPGNIFEDFFACLFCYPNVSVQLRTTLLKFEEKDKNNCIFLSSVITS